MKDNLLLHVALHLTPGVGNANTKSLISYIGDVESVFNSSKKELSRIPGIRKNTIQEILNKKTFSEAEEILRNCEKLNIRILHYTSRDFPTRLKGIYDAPTILYYMGNGDLNAMQTISIVGTRSATDYGRKITEKIVKGLKPYAPTVVSGLAYGIDIESHRHSLVNKLPTIAVLAGGLDRIYPRNHEYVATQMLEKGGLLSEYPPLTKPEAHMFPARNRIIAGLGDATIVVEAGKRGGALITANIADSYNKPVFAVPGNLDQEHSVGCNRLLRSQKALAYTEVSDLVYYLNWVKKSKAKDKVKIDFSSLTENERKIAEALHRSGNGLEIDVLSWKTQLQINHLAALLLNLEFQGVVKSLPGKKYQLK